MFGIRNWNKKNIKNYIEVYIKVSKNKNYMIEMIRIFIEVFLKEK